ncbi:MAG: type IVB secretion system protein IcmH/DotU [Motiliproteus sp.]
MTMDYLDEVTIEVAQEAAPQGGRSRALMLEGDAALKNQAQNLQDLRNYIHHDNRLLNVGSELLSLCVAVSRMPEPDDLYLFRQGIKRSITDLKQRMGSLDYPPSVADKTCFLFCIVLDEMILYSDWGENCSWENQTLVSELFGIRDGGEQFYQVAGKAMSQPNLLMELLELIYIFIKIGFKGQYRQSGRERLDELCLQLETVIFRDRPPVALCTNTRVKLPKVRQPQRRAKFGRQLVLFLAGVTLTWGGITYWYQSSFDQRARGFLGLSAFAESNRGDREQKEEVYFSTASEMDSTAGRHNGNVRATVPAVVAVETAEWIVQLATFDQQPSGFRFISEKSLQDMGAEVVEKRGRFLVQAQAENRQQASRLVALAHSKGIDDAFIFDNR